MKQIRAKLNELRLNIETFGRVIAMLYGVNKLYIFLMTVTTIFLGALPAIQIIVVQALLNTLQSSGIELRIVIYLIALYIGLDVSRSLTQYITAHYTTKFELLLSKEIRVLVLNKTRKLRLSDFENPKIYDVVRRAENEGDSKITNYFLSHLGIVRQLITLISTCTILLLYKWWMVMLICISPLIASLFMQRYNRMHYRIRRERTDKERQLWYIGYLLTNDISFKEIKLFNFSEYLLKQYHKVFDSTIKQDMDMSYKRTRTNIIIELCDQLIVASLLIRIILDAFYKVILIGNTMAYIRCISGIKSSINSLLSSVVAIFRDSLYINQIFELLDLPNEEVGLNKHNIDVIREIKIYNLSYKYPNSDKYALKNISVTFTLNQIHAIIGKNGSGKTTLMKILCGFYDDYTGQIFINGINLREINKESLRGEIGALFQDYSKYQLSLRENISIGDESILHNDIALNKTTRITEVDRIKHIDLDSQLGTWFKGGTQLSGGEWQKVALSRIFTRAHSLYILDEPNASLDTMSEAALNANMYPILKEGISIIVTHKISTLKNNVDKIIIINEGEIVDIGSHVQLLSRCDYYKCLYYSDIQMDLGEERSV